ncbi:MAG: 1-deoxy-D-xylulose-5-phosphate reductoisomerase [Chloroflexi bacterium]|nr:1-deoxy-D-xylulose-5-phosphate reductoisomerase [Chloroflexota bacterium]
MKKRIAVLGSTGSIGQQTLDVVRSFPDEFSIVALAAGQNTDLLSRQIAEFKPAFVYCQNGKDLLPDTGYKLLPMEEIACHSQVDIVLAATSGKAGLSAVMSAVTAGKTIALANKESLVMTGEIITRVASKTRARILPVDSEHSAIWQCLNGERQEPSRIILTASGGPFHNFSAGQLSRVTPEQALKHPSWQMGKKITIDSATLMNKGLEVIEAHWLFEAPFDNINVLIHPQSIIHSMVEFVDGSIKAQMSCPDMRLPIQYALSYPNRLPNPQLHRIEWNRIDKLTFEQPDFDTFPCLKLAIEAGRKGGTYPAVLCAADEEAVEMFLSGRIKFNNIADCVERALEQHQAIAHPGMEDVMESDERGRQSVREFVRESQC